ncbi:MAG: hypothetical protein ABIP14_12025 [Blastocatellia bacterium]
MQIQWPNLRGITTFILLIAISNFGNGNLAMALAAGNPGADNQVAGQLVVSGAVTVNDKKAINGTSIYSNSRLSVACANGNRAIVNLGKLGRIEIAPGTQMMLRFSDGIIGGDLAMGKIVVHSPAGVKIAINTPEGISAADGKDASLLAVATQRGVRCVPVMTTSQAGQSITLSSGALAAILLGAGGAAVAGAAVSSQTQVSSTMP